MESRHPLLVLVVDVDSVVFIVSNVYHLRDLFKVRLFYGDHELITLLHLSFPPGLPDMLIDLLCIHFGDLCRLSVEVGRF